MLQFLPLGFCLKVLTWLCSCIPFISKFLFISVFITATESKTEPQSWISWNGHWSEEIPQSFELLLSFAGTSRVMSHLCTGFSMILISVTYPCSRKQSLILISITNASKLIYSPRIFAESFLCSVMISAQSWMREHLIISPQEKSNNTEPYW